MGDLDIIRLFPQIALLGLNNSYFHVIHINDALLDLVRDQRLWKEHKSEKTQNNRIDETSDLGLLEEDRVILEVRSIPMRDAVLVLRADKEEDLALKLRDFWNLL